MILLNLWIWQGETDLFLDPFGEDLQVVTI